MSNAVKQEIAIIKNILEVIEIKLLSFLSLSFTFAVAVKYSLVIGGTTLLLIKTPSIKEMSNNIKKNIISIFNQPSFIENTWNQSTTLSSRPFPLAKDPNR